MNIRERGYNKIYMLVVYVVMHIPVLPHYTTILVWLICSNLSTKQFAISRMNYNPYSIQLPTVLLFIRVYFTCMLSFPLVGSPSHSCNLVSIAYLMLLGKMLNLFSTYLSPLTSCWTWISFLIRCVGAS